jgi:hypothetical protein
VGVPLCINMQEDINNPSPVATIILKRMPHLLKHMHKVCKTYWNIWAVDPARIQRVEHMLGIISHLYSGSDDCFIWDRFNLPRTYLHRPQNRCWSLYTCFSTQYSGFKLKVSIDCDSAGRNEYEYMKRDKNNDIRIILSYSTRENRHYSIDDNSRLLEWSTSNVTLQIVRSGKHSPVFHAIPKWGYTKWSIGDARTPITGHNLNIILAFMKTSSMNIADHSLPRYDIDNSPR